MNLKKSHAIGVILMLAASGVVHGMWTHRWSGTKADQTGRDLLGQLNGPIGDWEPTEILPVDAQHTPKGTVAIARSFVNEKNGKRTTVSLTSGIPGVVAAHTPDVCFLGSGYTLKSPPSKQTISMADGSTASFYVADFEKTTATGTDAVRCRWTWTADGTWQAPDYPRLFFAKSQFSLPVLYKLYIVQPLGDEDLNKSEIYRTFAVDLAQLGARYRQLQRELHPDRYAG